MLPLPQPNRQTPQRREIQTRYLLSLVSNRRPMPRYNGFAR